MNNQGKKILFYNKSISLGGQERMFIKFLNIVAESRNDIEVTIGDHKGEKNFFRPAIPTNLKLTFLTPESLNTRIEKYRHLRKKNILYKLLYSLAIKKRRNLRNQALQSLGASDEYQLIIDLAGDFPKSYTSIPIVIRFATALTASDDPTVINQFKRRISDSLYSIVTSETMKANALKMAPELSDRFVRIYNPLDNMEIQMKANETQHLSDIEKHLINKKYIIMSARIDEKSKDITSLIQAYSQVCDQIEEDLYIMGEGVDKLKLERLVKKLDRQNRVHFIGQKTNPYVWVKNASFLVHSSKTEGFPNTVLEGLSLGKAVIATNCKIGPAEILKDGEVGPLVEVGDVSKMAEWIKTLASDPQQRQIFETKAHQRAQDFDIEVVRQDILNLIQTALDKK